jgi:plasmid maintenance system killer protein
MECRVGSVLDSSLNERLEFLMQKLSNIEQFFEEASRRIPTQPFISDKDLPRPEYPQHDGFNPIESEGNDDVLTLLKDYPFASDNHLHDVSITDDDRRILDGGIREGGFDVYAFYKSRRYISASPYSGKWGIFYLEHGLERIGELIHSYSPDCESPLWRAYKFLQAHEDFHFKFDLYALSVEAMMGRELYSPLKRAFRHHRIYQVEEALANKHAYDWAISGTHYPYKGSAPRRRQCAFMKDFARDFMNLQPGAYARFNEDEHELAAELAANLLDLNLSQTARRKDQEFWVGNVPEKLLRGGCPEYFVRPATLTTWINPAWKLPEVRNITEAQAFTNLLSSKYASLQSRWEDAKKKLIANSALPGLEFKRWKNTGYWSIRVNDNFRVHLRPVEKSLGTWIAEEFGDHKSMGHG